METIKCYCNRFDKEVEFYKNRCLGCSLYPFNVGECPDRQVRTYIKVENELNGL